MIHLCLLWQYLDQQRYDDAYKAWRNAAALKPTHTVAWSNMIIMLDSIGMLHIW
jgi:hypothetical protein